ncbi:refilin B isoform X2 [Oryzias melastigma]|uniref:Refilin B n=1 Tax=Oryzias melastigma TaxID=30732 RepID=A0A3B3CEB5_ORYME|nr:refilin B isoform X2 [Oryzias melastigma]
MVGRLNFLNACEGDPLVMSCSRAERGLDSPDSGLPPSPSPSAWLPPASTEKARGSSPVSEDEGKGSLTSISTPALFPQLLPLSFGEGIALDPLPSKELRYTSSLLYDSDRHFIQNVTFQPLGQGLDCCRQTIVAVSHSTWRHYKTHLEFQPRQRPQHFKTTTIIYPKKTSAVYTTELSYDSHRTSKRFLSSVELEAVSSREPPQ